MKFIMYQCYDDIELFVIDDEVFEEFQYVYSCYNSGYKHTELILDVNKIEFGYDTVGKFINFRNRNGMEYSYRYASEFYNNVDIDKLKECIFKLCKHYNLSEFWFDGVDLFG